MSEEERQRTPAAMTSPAVIVKGAKESALLPHPPKVTRWKDAERDPQHVPMEVGPEARCSCGWAGSGWADHFVAVTKVR